MFVWNIDSCVVTLCLTGLLCLINSDIKLLKNIISAYFVMIATASLGLKPFFVSGKDFCCFFVVVGFAFFVCVGMIHEVQTFFV